MKPSRSPAKGMTVSELKQMTAIRMAQSQLQAAALLQQKQAIPVLLEAPQPVSPPPPSLPTSALKQKMNGSMLKATIERTALSGPLIPAPMEIASSSGKSATSRGSPGGQKNKGLTVEELKNLTKIRLARQAFMGPPSPSDSAENQEEVDGFGQASNSRGRVMGATPSLDRNTSYSPVRSHEHGLFDVGYLSRSGSMDSADDTDTPTASKQRKRSGSSSGLAQRDVSPMTSSRIHKPQQQQLWNPQSPSEAMTAPPTPSSPFEMFAVNEELKRMWEFAQQPSVSNAEQSMGKVGVNSRPSLNSKSSVASMKYDLVEEDISFKVAEFVLLTPKTSAFGPMWGRRSSQNTILSSTEEGMSTGESKGSRICNEVDFGGGESEDEIVPFMEHDPLYIPTDFGAIKSPSSPLQSWNQPHVTSEVEPRQTSRMFDLFGLGLHCIESPTMGRGA